MMSLRNLLKLPFQHPADTIAALIMVAAIVIIPALFSLVENGQ